MRYYAIALAVLLAGCGSNNPTPPPPLPPPPIIYPPWGGVISPQAPWRVSESSNPRPLDGNGGFTFVGGTSRTNVNCVTGALDCQWDSYVEVPLPVSINADAVYTLTYTATGDLFLCDSPNNTPNCSSVVGANAFPTIRLLLHRQKDNMSIGGEYGFYRFFSQYTAFTPGTHTLTMPLTLDYWMAAQNNAGWDINAEFVLTKSNLQSVGFCFGGGSFACHGVVVPPPNIGTFKIEAASIQ
jgi:hypothetical protein